jgi:two-component system LytT family response regulator
MGNREAHMDRKIRAIIVDDEPLARRTIRSLLQGFPEIEVVARWWSRGSTCHAEPGSRPAVLDIQMPEMNGFEVLKAASPDPFPSHFL